MIFSNPKDENCWEKTHLYLSWIKRLIIFWGEKWREICSWHSKCSGSTAINNKPSSASKRWQIYSTGRQLTTYTPHSISTSSNRFGARLKPPAREKPQHSPFQRFMPRPWPSWRTESDRSTVLLEYRKIKRYSHFRSRNWQDLRESTKKDTNRIMIQSIPFAGI